MGSVYKQQLNDWIATLDVKANLVLDIGGSQSPIKGRTKTWAVKEYKIVDLEDPHSDAPKPDYAQDMNERLQLKLKADLIFMLGVMDYIINPNIALQNIYDLLTDDGAAWIEWPFVYAHHNPIMQEGCRYSEGCLNRLVKQANLGIVEIVRKMAGSPKLVEFYHEDRQRMARQYPYHGVTGFITKVAR